MAYKNRKMTKSAILRNNVVEGEPIEHKMARILSNNEPISDGAPEIYTERKDGVGAEYNVRTDRWELATEAMDLNAKNVQAKKRMIETYNTIYMTNYSTGTNCGSCLSTCYDGIKKLYNKYKTQ